MKQMKFSEWIAKAGTAAAAVGGFITVTVMLTNPSLEFVLTPFVLAGLAPLTAGVFGFKHYHEKYLKRIDNELESKLLELLMVHKNNLTIAQIALTTKLPVEDIEKAMDKLHKKGVLEINVSEGGAILYRLPEIGNPLQQNLM
ncbi:MAG: hypothetical protein EAZ97_13695 [Bacteroidetes bacterium]|nr:MAG: hypothetical protein EAZ97_13695 [Bacteroidota bacterium]